MKMKKKKNKKITITRRDQIGMVFVLPFIIGLFVFFIPALINLFRFSMSDIQILPRGGGYKLDFVGFSYYHKALMEDPKFNRMLPLPAGNV